jgi:hypothetical protein
MAKTEMTIEGGHLLEQLTISIRIPRAFAFRMWLTIRLLAVARLVSPVEIEAEIGEREPSKASTWTRYEGNTAEGGKIVLSHYPERFILRHHGEVGGREWEDTATNWPPRIP